MKGREVSGEGDQAREGRGLCEARSTRGGVLCKARPARGGWRWLEENTAEFGRERRRAEE